MVKRYLSPGFLLIASGVTAITLSTFADSIGIGHPGFGLKQLSGLVIGFLMSMGGLLNVHTINTKIVARVLTVICVGGILYMGLRPGSFNPFKHGVLLDVSYVDLQDFAINTMGFVPLGFLLMLCFKNRRKDQRANLFKRAIIVVGVGGLISLFLETSQYYLILGRDSSLFDCISNTFGTLLGISVYLILREFAEVQQRNY